MKEPHFKATLLNRYHLFLTFILLFPFFTYAELSSSLINQIYQDNKGYIWIATEDGLDRYYGAKFSIYKQDKEDSTSVLNNYVKSI